MPIKIRFSPEADADLVEAVGYIRAESGIRAGSRWRRGLLELAQSLDQMPLRGALAAEEELAALGVRELRYHSHRVLYRVGENEIEIARVYHSRRDRLRARDLPREEPSAGNGT